MHFRYLKIGTTILFVLSVFFVTTSCREWTPEADAWYTVDGRRYQLSVMVIYDGGSLNQAQSDYEVILQGASAYNIDMTIKLPTPGLNSGTYPITNSYSGIGVHSMRVLRGNLSEDINIYDQSTGSLTINRISNDKYVLDFTGVLNSHSIVFHYDGLVAHQSH